MIILFGAVPSRWMDDRIFLDRVVSHGTKKNYRKKEEVEPYVSIKQLLVISNLLSFSSIRRRQRTISPTEDGFKVRQFFVIFTAQMY